jgi:branched-chain amino acid transport system ATP-binding protein
MALLEVENVRHCFTGLVALDKVNFRVAEGQVKAVIGPNGAGKTTLFNIVSGIFKPTAGEIRFMGSSIVGLQPYQIADRGVSRTFQNLSLFLRMTVLENVMIGRHIRTHMGFVPSALRLPGQGREEKAMRESAVAQLSELGLAAVADVQAGSLSFGQRRMVELARALATEPKLLLLDEPASGLNTREKEGLAGIIAGIHKRNVTILLVEHDVSLVMDVSDEILVLNYGVPIAEGPPSMIRNHKDVVAVYLGGEFSDAAN